jgi:hypothetical protein
MANPNAGEQQPFEEKNGERPHSVSSSQTARDAANAPARVAHFPSNDPVTEKHSGEKVELTEDECYDELGFSFSNTKKWMILTVIFLVQTSMNFNTSLYSNAIGGISSEYNVSEQAARVGAAIFLVFYAFGCELWAPWSEG